MDNRLLSSISPSHPTYFDSHAHYMLYRLRRDLQHQHKQEYIPSFSQYHRDFLRSSISHLISQRNIIHATYLRFYMVGDHMPAMTFAISQQLQRRTLWNFPPSDYIPAKTLVNTQLSPNLPTPFHSNQKVMPSIPTPTIDSLLESTQHSHEDTAACLTTHPALFLQHQHFKHQDLLLQHSHVQTCLTQLEDHTIPTLHHAIDHIPPLSASHPSPDVVTHLHLDYIPPLSAPHPSPDDVTHLHFQLSDLQDTLIAPPVLTNLLPPRLPPIKSNCYRINLSPPLLANRPNKPPTFTKISLPILHPLLLLLPIFPVLHTLKPLTFHHESPD